MLKLTLLTFFYHHLFQQCNADIDLLITPASSHDETYFLATPLSSYAETDFLTTPLPTMLKLTFSTTPLSRQA
jgi:hypothetical protein